MELGYLAVFYLIGSIPVAWLVTKWVGNGDIRSQGSGNAGVMNVAIHVSRWAGLLVFLAEIAKGVLTVILARKWQLSDTMTGLAVVVAVLGTRWSIWLYGDGGRGNTLGVAALLVLAWPVVVISLVVWLAARLLTRSSFWATRCWLLMLPLASGLVMKSWSYVLMGALLALLYMSAHKIETDDHAILKQTWPNLWAFITAPRRRRHAGQDEACESFIGGNR